MKIHHPTPAELYALEQKARRLRAEEIGRYVRAGANAVRRLLAVRPAKGLRHA